MIDYPGKLACVLFTIGCNFHCPYCHNPELALNQVDPAETLGINEVIELLTERQGFIDGVVITGGEPALHHQTLTDACKRIKQLGYPLKLDTNGSHPEVIKSLLAENLLDYIAMDIKSTPERYAPLIWEKANERAILDSIEMILNAGIAHEFRTTCIHPLVSLQTISTISTLIEGADLYVLQQFHTKGVLDPSFCQARNRRFDTRTLEIFRSTAETRVKKCILR